MLNWYALNEFGEPREDESNIKSIYFEASNIM